MFISTWIKADKEIAPEIGSFKKVANPTVVTKIDLPEIPAQESSCPAVPQVFTPRRSLHWFAPVGVVALACGLKAALTPVPDLSGRGEQ
eukprot:gene8781-3932_t